ncbi:DUF1212-domain-containing protein [Trametes versicolor FP-101664 SS1]|uniref:DUF1212-domain-containing protein n=1 Tax=Trametes versicolor (strain FP-101664) TaxID=717944 RepID=UPI0004623568|nr:DUF1212-domain-containing protein [Trametes versicolor FP-101664 SS1]EIW52517.1 DUF1212-domain-containing protein [Trametes versicolor FP-101664 SS1]
MDSPPHMNPSDPTAPADNRPPGGTRRSGHKTPRKVQWVFDETDGSPSSRALDEHALDPDAFETLASALERHRSSSMSEGNSSRPMIVTAAPTAISPEPSLPTSPELSPQPTPHEVPGENFIDRHETAGLPGVDIEEYSQEQAKKVVRAHKYGFLRGLGGGGKRHKRSRSQEPLANSERRGRQTRKGFFTERHTPGGDVEKSAEVRNENKRDAPKGVLSTLLSFYEPSNGFQSGMSTPGRSSLDESRPSSVYSGKTANLTESGSTTSSAVLMPPPPVPNRAEGSGYAPSMPNPSTNSLRPPSHPWTRTLGLPDARPSAARSGAGVFGPLIASAGNIAGVAAPAPATVAPNCKRPGYHLSRYSLESSLPKASQSQRSLTLSRSRSMHFDPQSRSPTLLSVPPSPADESPPLLHPSNGSPGHGRQKWTGVLKDLPKWVPSRAATPSTAPGTPATDLGTDEWLSEKEFSGAEDRKREKRQKRKKAEIWITRHVAEIVARQEFILKLARAMMMFGGPTHRLQAQIQATGKVLDTPLSCMYLPDMMLISFEDPSTSTSSIKFIRQGSSLDIGKLQEAHKLYWTVIHDEISVKDASSELDKLMLRKPIYKNWQIILIGGACSASICSVSFNGSFIDSLMSFPLGCLLIVIQLFAGRNELYSNVFEITVATIFSFIAAALSSSRYFCYSAIASSSVVLILPGFIVLCGSLELSSRNIVSGAVRVCFSCIYSLFLGFGLAIGATAYSKISHHSLAGSDDLTCGLSHDPDGPWWQRTPSLWWAFLTVPLYSLFLSLRNYAPWKHRELYLLVAISCIGWVTNHFTGTRFRNQSDISAAAGALAVGFVANLYGRFFNGNAFVIMITGILFQLPSGLANGGLFTFVQQQESGSSSNEAYLSGFQTALQLISVAIGLTVGLGISLVLVHPIPSRRRGTGMFTL